MESTGTWSYGVDMTPRVHGILGMGHGKSPHRVCWEVSIAPLWTTPWMHYGWIIDA